MRAAHPFLDESQTSAIIWADRSQPHCSSSLPLRLTKQGLLCCPRQPHPLLGRSMDDPLSAQTSRRRTRRQCSARSVPHAVPRRLHHPCVRSLLLLSHSQLIIPLAAHHSLPSAQPLSVGIPWPTDAGLAAGAVICLAGFVDCIIFACTRALFSRGKRQTKSSVGAASRRIAESGWDSRPSEWISAPDAPSPRL